MEKKHKDRALSSSKINLNSILPLTSRRNERKGSASKEREANEAKKQKVIDSVITESPTIQNEIR